MLSGFGVGKRSFLGAFPFGDGSTRYKVQMVCYQELGFGMSVKETPLEGE